MADATTNSPLSLQDAQQIIEASVHSTEDALTLISSLRSTFGLSGTEFTRADVESNLDVQAEEAACFYLWS